MPVVEVHLPRAPSEQHVTFREQVADAFEGAESVIKAATSPLPTQTGDGSYVQTTKTTGLLKDVTKLHPGDVRTIAKTALTVSPIDDSSFLLERLVKLSSELPLSSRDGTFLNNAFIQQLYDDLQHPPTAAVSSDHKYRSADGSFNVSLLDYCLRSWRFAVIPRTCCPCR